jgi:MoaA/NifB/PqqE/SkfB family radical SAM enzyme
MCDIPTKYHNQELTSNEIKEIVKFTSDLGVKTIAFSGGEPLLRKDLEKMIEFSKKFGLQVHITTNGWLINETKIKSLKKAGLDIINISLDGPEEIHDWLRGKGSYKKAIWAAQLAKINGIRLTIASIVIKQNYKFLPFLVRLAHQLGASSMKLQPFSLLFLNHMGKEKSFMIQEDIVGECNKYIKEALSLAKVYQIDLNPKSYLNNIASYLSGRKITPPEGRCRALFNTCSIDFKGNIYGCWQIRNPIGNIRQKSIYLIWNGKVHNKLRKFVGEKGCPGCLMSCYDTIYEKPHLISLWKLRQRISVYTLRLTNDFINAISLAKYYEFLLKILAKRIENYEYK